MSPHDPFVLCHGHVESAGRAVKGGPIKKAKSQLCFLDSLQCSVTIETSARRSLVRQHMENSRVLVMIRFGLHGICCDSNTVLHVTVWYDWMVGYLVSPSEQAEMPHVWQPESPS